MDDLKQLAGLLQERNRIDDQIAALIRRPASTGAIGEFIAAAVFKIELNPSAAHKGYDGSFQNGPLAGAIVNIKYYPKNDGLLDLKALDAPQYYLVLTGPRTAPGSSYGTTRPLVIESVFLFDALPLRAALQGKVRFSEATSVRRRFWDAAEIYPRQNNPRLALSQEQRGLLRLFVDGSVRPSVRP